jgi:hypothetical protein
MRLILAILLAGFSFFHTPAQINPPEIHNFPIEVQYISLRPARWEEKALIEDVNEKRNLGGLILVYYKNVSDKPVTLREWYLNKRESGHFRLAGDIAWDRRYTNELQPGQTSVLEINGVSSNFQIDKKAEFSWIGSDWNSVAFHPSLFEPEKLRVTSMVIDASLSTITIHIRSFVSDEVIIKSISCEGKNSKLLALTSGRIESNSHAIARIQLDQPLTPGELVIIKIDSEVTGQAHTFYSHRNAYADYFPNGTWGIEEHQYADARIHHLNTMVRGGHANDKFFSQDYKTTGIMAMPHTGIYPNVDMMRNLENHPAVALWYIHDEPDWLYTPQLLMASHEMTKIYSTKKPTLITLCRNVKFFEFAFIADIPCHDHYCVTAPTTSKWPFVYGTKLEETGYYTADLKYAAEPKPIWVWTQGVHLWDERPRMPLPTPDELGAQLYFNLSRGAKGNLWFTFLEEAGTRFPATKKALQRFSRIIKLLEQDLLVSDPYHGQVTAPDQVDVGSLITADQLILFITNTNYQINDSAYQWTTAKKVKVQLKVPHWFNTSDGFELSPEDGIHSVKWKMNEKFLELTLDELKMGRVFVFSVNKDSRKHYQSHFSELIGLENSR